MRAIPPGLGWRVAAEGTTEVMIGTTALQASPVPEGAAEIGWHPVRDRLGVRLRH